ncbi:hypothetical protein LAZ67_3005828, partial [Cordylochernes scorpioides]
MNRTKNSTHAGSSVARSNKGRLSCLGRGQDKEKKLQSPTQKDLKILQLNVEGFTRAKGEIIEKMMREHKADVIALQETHTPENSKSAIRIPGYVIICSKPHPKFGLAIYITYKLREETKVLPETSHSIGIQINDLSIYNVYKPPSQLWIPTSLPSPQHPAIVLGDFNSHHTLWGYSSTDNEGESLNDWMEINDMQLIFDAKKQGTFQSARWGKTYSPDLCFVTKDQCDNPIQIAHKILTKFPKSQHCPSIYEMGIQIPQIDSAPIPRWNLGKANWEAFTKYIEDNINLIPPTPKNYSRASNLIISCAKKFIPRGHRKIYIPCWSPESERLYQEYNLSGNTETAENLIRSLDDSRKHRWHTMLEQMDFSKSSRKSWSLLRKLGGADPPHKHNQLTNPNKIATCISSKSRIHPNPSEKSRLKKVIGTNLSKSSTHPQLSTNIDLNEVEDAIKVTHNNRAPGPDGIMPEFMKHLGQKAIKWMAKLFTNILSTGSIPSVWKQAKVLAILKPGKTSDDPNNYRPISLLCIPYKILERIILNRISPIIEEYLPIEQAGFRPGRNCAEQTLALTTTIEDGFQKKLKTGAVFVDLTAAYDTVWREGLLYKLSKIINCKNIIKLINNFLTNRKITVHLNNKKSRPRTLNNGLPQGSVLAPLLFNVYTADIPATNSQKFLYADDIALLHQEQSFSTLEQILNEDLKKLENFFSKWHLIPNPSKTVSSVFHLNNHKANRPLKLTFCNKPLSHDPCPKYLGVTLDRSLTFRQHLEKTRDKLKTRNNIMTRLAGTTWGCGADTLRTTALALVYSVAEYCAPVWERSSHTDSIDAQLNQTMRLITGNMRPTPIDWLPYLSNIAPPDLRRKKSTSNLLSKIKANTKLPINTVLEIPPPTRLISRNPAWVADENVDLKEEWRNRWSNLAIANKDLVEDPNTKPPGYNLPRRTWSPLLRIQGTMTAQRYFDDVLRPVTLPFLQGVHNALYQQDNARPHTARISQQALQDVQMFPWPPYSPDLSPIEHVWDIIGRRLHALPQPHSEDELWQMVEREWRAIPQDAIRTLIDSLPRRVAACIAVRVEVTSARVDQHVLRQAVADPHATCISILKNVQYTLDHFISTRTIFRRLAANGLHSCRPVKLRACLFLDYANLDFIDDNDANFDKVADLDQVKNINPTRYVRYGKSNLRIIILSFLLISVIESNPGHKTTRQTTLETSMEKDLRELIAALTVKIDDWGSKIEYRLSSIELGMQKFDSRVQQLESSLEDTTCAVASNAKNTSEFERRVEFLEMKNREKNLVFYGIEGSGTETSNESCVKIKRLLKDNMQIYDEIDVSKCRRLSKRDKAPILVEVSEHSERMKILKNSFKFKDINVFVNKDYSPSIREQRRILISKRKEFLNKGINAKLRDNKLIVNGTVYQASNGKITTKEDLLITSKRKYLSLLKYKKNKYSDSVQAALSNVRDSAEFWKIIASFKKRNSTKGNIDISEWESFYQGLLSPPQRIVADIPTLLIPIDPELDAEISLLEIVREIASLKNNKAAGYDSILNEAIKALPENGFILLSNLFNKILTKSQVPSQWSKTIIQPIFKNGDPNAPSNYRGIALISNLSKLFTSILKNRL